jgi:hypothetical protein
MSEKLEFDITKPENIGRPYYWHLDVHIKAVIQMIQADEIQIALEMLDKIPGYYRDNYPKELNEIKRILYRQMYDQFDYANDEGEAGWKKEDVIAQCLTDYTFPRANILAEEIKNLNTGGLVPWICELSASHGWLPIGFSERRYQFTYFAKNLNAKALDKIKEWLKQDKDIWRDSPPECAPKILVFYEALEHMNTPSDFTQAAHKLGHEFDQIYLSTPKYTLWGGLPDWSTRRIGHVRTWTTSEFGEFARTSFPGFTWTLYDHHSMVLVGKRTQ